MLQADAIHMQYPTPTGSRTVLRDISLTLDAGESATVMGPSGSGKSTLLNILGTLDTPTAGRITIDGCDPSTLAEHELAAFRNHRIGFVFQDHHLLPQLTALENVLLPTLAGANARAAGFSPRGSANQTRAAGLSPRERPRRLKPAAQMDAVMDRALHLLDRVGLSDRLHHHPAELSGGERQRVAIARSLVNGPAVLLADEPTGNLDRSSADRVADVLAEVHMEEKNVLVVVTHNDELAERAGHRFDLIDGTLVAR